MTLTMAGAIYNLDAAYAVLFVVVLAMAACDAPDEGAIDQTDDQVTNPPSISSPDVTLDQEELAPESELVASADILRPNGFYQLEWDNTAALCTVALDALNKPYALSPQLRTTPDALQTNTLTNKQRVI